MDLTLDHWRETFERIDDCPWPGPRPLRPDDPEAWLCGREEDKRTFRKDVDENRVVFLAGSSGVGKTSLLQRGLIPALIEHGYVVAMCRDWSDTSFDSPATFLANQVAKSVAPQDPTLPKDPTVIGALQKRYGDRSVIVLDQFEELIRDEPEFADRLFKFLAKLSRGTDIKLVVSLRSEHLHELRPFEHQIQSYSTSHYFLEEVGDESVPAVAAAGNVLRPGAIQPAVIEEVARLWAEARAVRSAPNQGRTAIGLLHLQAVLYALHARTGGATVTMEALSSLRRDLGARDSGAGLKVGLFAEALGRAVEVKLDRCRRASVEVGVDPYLIEGATSTLSASVRHLSSAGFKLVRDAEDLAEATIGTDLDRLRGAIAASRCANQTHEDGPHFPAQEVALFRIITDALRYESLANVDQAGWTRVDFLAANREDIALAADATVDLADDVIRVGWTDRLRDRGRSPFDCDPKEATQGPLMGRSPAAAFIEEHRRFAFALEWMRASVLCRVSATSTNATRVALIHDGFGPALETWSQRQADRPAQALYGITAPRGSEFAWPTDSSSFLPELDAPGPDEPRILANIRWRGASIVNTGFRHVVFVNCDLRGSMFIRCRFEGATFVNCLLDGVMFTDCALIGPASERPETWQEEATGFLVAASSRTAGEMAPYDDATESGLLVSDLPFYPARVGASTGPLRTVAHEIGSVVIVGGRVSSLTSRGTSFHDRASFCLRETVGSGFDFVEHGRERDGSTAADSDTARVEVTGSLLRHLTFTTAPHRLEDQAVPELVVDVRGSVVAQAWFGDDLEGRFEAADSILLGVWNGADPDTFVATAHSSSTYHGLVGVRVDETCSPINADERIRAVGPMYEAERGGRPLNLKGLGIAMDYRRDASLEEAVVRDAEEASA